MGILGFRIRTHDPKDEEPLPPVAKFLVYGLLPPFGLYQLYVGVAGLLAGHLAVTYRSRGLRVEGLPAYFFSVTAISLGLIAILGPIYLGLLPHTRRMRPLLVVVALIMFLSIIGGYAAYFGRAFLRSP